MKDKNYNTWKELLNLEWLEFANGDSKGFSTENNKHSKWFGHYLSDLQGKVLDIGCGVISRPIYMTYAREVDWYGIDPLGADIEREFNFKLGIAEDIPYENNFFDGVVFSSSLNHLCNVEKAISEVNRILKPSGVVIVWTGLITQKKFNKWKIKGGKVDNKHLWGFTKHTLLNYFSNFKLLTHIEDNGQRSGHIFFFRK